VTYVDELGIITVDANVGSNRHATTPDKLSYRRVVVPIKSELAVAGAIGISTATSSFVNDPLSTRSGSLG
jgi:hypothetical protein